MSCQASVIIPTYNRAKSIEETLDALGQQDFSVSDFEVIVIDDGSTDETRDILQKRYPFNLRYIYHPNQGSTYARNQGAVIAKGSILIFIDDDVWVNSGFVIGLVKAHNRFERTICMGCKIPYIPPNPTRYAEIMAKSYTTIQTCQESKFTEFTECMSHNISIERGDYFKLGGFKDILPHDGASTWCDLEFGYRAYQQDFRFFRSGNAVCCHRDYGEASLEAAKKRTQKFARLAVLLFNQYPGLVSYISMYNDMKPIHIQEDSSVLIMRKLIRRFFAASAVTKILEQLIKFLEKKEANDQLLKQLYRLDIRSYMVKGYREGLKLYGSEARNNK